MPLSASPPSPHDTSAPRALIITAFLTVYLVWGSTYLAIKIGIESLPPLLLASLRFLIAGGLMYLALRARGQRLGDPRHWRHAAVVGTALLAGGNGGVSWAERTIPSGIAALVIASVPLWFAIVDWIRPGGRRPAPRTWLGIAVGFCGMLVLAAPAGSSTGPLDPLGLLILFGACVSWAAGSIYSRHTPKPEFPLMAVAAQMLCGGAVLLILSLLLGEMRGFHPAAVSLRSIGALVYLITFGSWAGFTAYIWLLKASTPARVSSYAYVNPVVAVFLGWVILDEPVTPRTLLAASIIIAAVVVLTLPGSTPAPSPKPPK